MKTSKELNQQINELAKAVKRQKMNLNCHEFSELYTLLSTEIERKCTSYYNNSIKELKGVSNEDLISQASYNYLKAVVMAYTDETGCVKPEYSNYDFKKLYFINADKFLNRFKRDTINAKKRETALYTDFFLDMLNQCGDDEAAQDKLILKDMYTMDEYFVEVNDCFSDYSEKTREVFNKFAQLKGDEAAEIVSIYFRYPASETRERNIHIYDYLKIEDISSKNTRKIRKRVDKLVSKFIEIWKEE